MDPTALNIVSYTRDPVGGPAPKLKLKFDPPGIRVWILHGISYLDP